MVNQPDHQFILIVPPTGLLEVIHADRPIDPEFTLRARGEDGNFMRLTCGKVTCSWFNQDWGTLNPRARTVFARIAQVHFIFTGPVLFEGIEEDLMGEIVGQLSLRETAGGSTS